MKTLSGRFRHQPEPTKGSRFIASVAPVATEAAARSFLSEISKELPDASHHCWAWRLANPVVDRAGDDGEPSGSAGRPILAQLTGRDLVNVAAVVTRWFGGTKLGVGGLVRAYGGAAAEALDLADTVEYRQLTTITVEHDYPVSDAIERAIRAIGAEVVDNTFGSEIRRLVQVADDDVAQLTAAIADASSGQAVIIEGEEAG